MLPRSYRGPARRGRAEISAWGRGLTRSRVRAEGQLELVRHFVRLLPEVPQRDRSLLGDHKRQLDRAFLEHKGIFTLDGPGHHGPDGLDGVDEHFLDVPVANLVREVRRNQGDVEIVRVLAGDRTSELDLHPEERQRELE